MRAAMDADIESDSLRVVVAAAEREAADWTRLADDLGRDGLQAALVDLAGPELTQTANELLHACVGPRWTVSVETQRASADGKRTLEGCEVRVIDTLKGRDATVESLSGGERTIVAEALALALTALSCRVSGVRRPTLIRDESGAALDGSNSEAYVAMLRRSADMIGADRVLVVSQTSVITDRCDAEIRIEEGKVRLA